MEVIVVMAVLSVLAALLFPVFSRAVRSSHQSATTSHLRQIGTALALYKEQEGDYPLRHLDPLVESGILREKTILMSPCDATSGGYGTMMRRLLEPPGPPYATSYETAYVSEAFYKQLFTIDENAAVVVNRTCGTWDPRMKAPAEIMYAHWGAIARLKEDTSVKIGRFWFEPGPDGRPTVWRRLRLFTEKPLPALPATP